MAVGGNSPQDLFHSGGVHPRGSQFLFVDGATKLVNYEISLETLRPLSTRAGSDPVPAF